MSEHWNAAQLGRYLTEAKLPEQPIRTVGALVDRLLQLNRELPIMECKDDGQYIRREWIKLTVEENELTGKQHVVIG